MDITDRTDYIVKCPKCNRSAGLRKKKKINQRKYRFVCLFCEKTFSATLHEGFEVCKKCSGAGVLDLGNNTLFLIICDECNGFGSLDWLERIKGPPNYDSFTVEGHIFWMTKKKW